MPLPCTCAGGATGCDEAEEAEAAAAAAPQCRTLAAQEWQCSSVAAGRERLGGRRRELGWLCVPQWHIPVGPRFRLGPRAVELLHSLEDLDWVFLCEAYISVNRIIKKCNYEFYIN